MGEKDNKLYHYTKVDTLIKYILKNTELRTGKLINSNDPKETSSMKFFVTTGESNYNKRNEILSSFFNDDQKIINREIKKFSNIICFSVDSDAGCKGYNHPRMWAQYSENNKGICLVLDKNEFQKEFNKKFKDYKTYHGKVSYNFRKIKEYTKAYRINLKNKNNIDEIIQMKIDKFYQQYFFSKHYDWIHENEYRYVINSNVREFFHISIDNSLKKIILGNSLTLDKKKEINKLLDNLKSEVELFEYSYSHGCYNLIKI